MPSIFVKPMHKKEIVVFAIEADGALVAALNDVPRNAGKGKAGAAGMAVLSGAYSGQRRREIMAPYCSRKPLGSSRLAHVGARLR